jgi:dihydrofolate reductase
MSRVIVFMSMSVDGFIAGPTPAPNNPLGDHGPVLHDWIFAHSGRSQEVTRSFKKDIGAIIMGHVMYEESLPWWNGTEPLGDVPCFVLVKEGSEPENAASMFTFVTDGIEKALELARKSAGNKNVFINGGGNTIQQYIKADLVDELTIHLVPVILGGGTSLFGSLGEYIELDKESVSDEMAVTHLKYRIKRK